MSSKNPVETFLSGLFVVGYVGSLVLFMLGLIEGIYFRTSSKAHIGTVIATSHEVGGIVVEYQDDGGKLERVENRAVVMGISYVVGESVKVRTGGGGVMSGRIDNWVEIFILAFTGVFLAFGLSVMKLCVFLLFRIKSAVIGD